MGKALTEIQIRSWLSSEKTRNKPAPPGWFQAGNPDCIWEGHNLTSSEINQVELENEQDDNDLEGQYRETERELTLVFPVNRGNSRTRERSDASIEKRVS